MEIRKNKNCFDLWCIGCKERIKVGEDYVVVVEEIYNGELIDKTYHNSTDCIPETEDDDEYVITDEPHFHEDCDCEGSNESGDE